jgi:hypothetical protein
MLDPMRAKSRQARVSARAHRAALARWQKLGAQNECLRDELRRHSSGALQIRAASRKALQWGAGDAWRGWGRLHGAVLLPWLSRIFRR